MGDPSWVASAARFSPTRQASAPHLLAWAPATPLEGLLKRYRRRAGSPIAPLDLPRPCRPGCHLLVSVGRSRAPRPRRPAPRAPPRRTAAVSALALTLQAFFTDRRSARPAAPGEPADDRRLPRYLAAPLDVRRRANPHAPVEARHRPSRCGADRRVPRPPRRGARQQHAHPQRAARGDPLAIPIRRALPSRARGAHRARAGHSPQAVRAQSGHVPHG